MDSGSLADWFAGIASFAAVIVALLGYFILECNRRRDDLERKRAIANQIGISIMIISNLTKTVHQHVHPELENRRFDSENPSSVITPMIGIEKDHLGNVKQEYLVLLSDLKEFKLMNDILVVSDRLRSIFISMDEYKLLYFDLQRKLPAPKKIEGAIENYELTKDQLLSLAPFRANLNSIIVQIKGMTEQNIVMCASLMEDFHGIIKPHFPGRGFVVLGRQPQPPV